MNFIVKVGSKCGQVGEGVKQSKNVVDIISECPKIKCGKNEPLDSVEWSIVVI